MRPGARAPDYLGAQERSPGAISSGPNSLMESGRGPPFKEQQRGSESGAEADVDIEKPGRALSREISQGEIVEADLDRFIEGRSKTLEAENREHFEEAAWAESARRHNAAREAQLREAWCTYHQEQAGRHRAVLEALAAHHEARAAELELMNSEARGPGGDAA
jgi:hypothetical protein